MTYPPATGVSRRSFLLGGTATAVGASLLVGPGRALAEVLPAAPAEPLADGASAARAFGFPEPDMTSRIVRDITFPVDGPVSWTDTYGYCRDGCSRRHEGQDLMAQKLTRLVAARDGVVVARTHESGGNSIYVQDDDGWYYAYLHVNNDTPFTDDGRNPVEWAFAPGTTVGSRVRRGQFIGYVGDSGNAESTGAHCHFEIRKPTSAGVWRAQAINPKYSLDEAKPPPPRVPASTFRPWSTSTDLINQQYADFFGSAPDASSLAYYRKKLDEGAQTPDWLIQVLLQANGCQNEAGAIVRLYHAHFGRYPDQDGFDYWVGRARAGRKLVETAQHFATSTEFVRTFGDLSDAAFVETVYRNVLGREPETAGRDYWLGRLRSGSVGRGRLMIEFSESSENRNRRRIPTNVVLLHGLMLKRIPSVQEIDDMVATLEAGTLTTQAVILAMRSSPEYAARF